jgi:hypothetical protein
MKILYTNKNSKIIYAKTPGKKFLKTIGKILLFKVHFQKWPKPNKTLDFQKPPTITAAVELFSEIEKHAQIKNSFASGVFSKTTVPHRMFLNLAFTLASFLVLLPAYGFALVAKTSFDIWTEEPSVVLSLAPRINGHGINNIHSEVLGVSTIKNLENENILPKKITPKTAMLPEDKNIETEIKANPISVTVPNNRDRNVLGIQTTSSFEDLDTLVEQKIEELIKNGKIASTFTESINNSNTVSYTSSIGGVPIVGYLPQDPDDDYTGASISSFDFLSSGKFSTGQLKVSETLSLIEDASLEVTGETNLATTTIQNLTVTDSITANSFLGNGNNFAVLSNGNVGIGSSTPSQKLTVNGGNILQTSSDPVVIGSMDKTTEFPDGYRMKVFGDYALVTNYNATPGKNNLNIIDISNPTNPKLVGKIDDDTNLKSLDGMTVAGKYAYLGSNSNGFSVVDISNPSKPLLASHLPTSNNFKDVIGIHVIGKYAFVVNCNATVDFLCQSGGVNMSVLDVSNPKSPQVVSTLSNNAILGGSLTSYAQGNFIYVGNYASSTPQTSFAIIDATNPLSPTITGSLEHTTNLARTSGITVSAGYAYVVNSDTEAGKNNFTIIDVASSTNPTVVGGIDDDINLRNAQMVSVRGHYAYVDLRNTDDHTTYPQFVVIDISDPTHPYITSTLKTPGLSQLNGMTVNGKYAYLVGDAYSSDTKSFMVLDISGIDSPTANIGQIKTNQLTVSGSADITNGLSLFGGLNAYGGILSQGAVTIQGYGTSSLATLDVRNATGTPLFRVLDSGTVLVGTSTLVNGGSKQMQVFTNTLNQGLEIRNETATSTGGWTIGLNTTADALGNTQNTANYAWAANATTNWAYYAASGMSFFADRIGINTTSPSATLAVTGLSGVNPFTVASSSGVNLFNILQNGNVGIGTSDPSVKLNIANGDFKMNTFGDNAGDGGTYWQMYFRSRGTEASPTIVQSGDEVGVLSARAYDGTVYRHLAQIRFSVDGTPGVADMPGRISFSTSPDGNASVIERMRITNSGIIGIGTTSTSSMVSIQASAGTNPFNISSSTGTSLFTILQNGYVGIGTSTPTLGPLVMASGAYVTSGGTWTNASDRNLKENFQDLDPIDILQKIANLPIQQWNYKAENASTTHIGPMAQDFYSAFGLGGSETSISTIDPAGVALLGLKTFAQNLVLQGGLTGNATVTSLTVKTHLHLNEDTVGEAKILAGQTSVTITFVENYTEQPIVTATPMDFVSGAYRVTAVNQSGFTIELKEQQATDITFGWHAFGAFNAKLTVSDGSKQDVILITQVNLPPPPPQTPPPIVSPDSGNNTPPTPPEENNNQPAPEEQAPPSEPEPQPPVPNSEVTP